MWITTVLTYTVAMPMMFWSATSNLVDVRIAEATQRIEDLAPAAPVPDDGALNINLDFVQQEFVRKGYEKDRWSSKARYVDMGDGLGHAQVYQGRVLVSVSNRFENPNNPMYGSGLERFVLAHEWAHVFLPDRDTDAMVLALEVLAGENDTDKRDFWRAWWFITISARYVDQLEAGNDAEAWLQGVRMTTPERRLYNEFLGAYRGAGAMNAYFRMPTYAILNGLDSGIVGVVSIPNLQSVLLR